MLRSEPTSPHPKPAYTITYKGPESAKTQGSLLAYVAAQVFMGRGIISYEPNVGLIYWFAPTAYDRERRPELDGILELWLVMEFEED
jgi:hypothetical protein